MMARPTIQNEPSGQTTYRWTDHQENITVAEPGGGTMGDKEASG